MRSNSKQVKPSVIVKERGNHFNLKADSREGKTNINVSQSSKNMFDLNSRSEAIAAGLEGREVGLQPWSLNRRIVEESMLAYTSRAHNLSNQQHTRHSHQSVNHRDRLAVQALMQRARGHNRWAPLPKIDRKPDTSLTSDFLYSTGFAERSVNEDKRATSDLGVKVLYNSDWDTGSPPGYTRRPFSVISDTIRDILPAVKVFQPHSPRQAFIGTDRTFDIDLHEPSVSGRRPNREKVEADDTRPEADDTRPEADDRGPEADDSGPSDDSRSPAMSSNHVGQKTCAVEIVAFPEIPLQATPAVLHSNPKSAKKLTSPRKGTHDSKKQGYQFVHRSNLPPLPKIEGRRKIPPIIARKEKTRKGTPRNSPSPSADKDDKAAAKLSYKLSRNGVNSDRNVSSPRLDGKSAESENQLSIEKTKVREKGLISVTVRKRTKGPSQDGAETVDSFTNTCALPLEESDVCSQTSSSLPIREGSDSSGIRSVLRKGDKKSGKSVQFGDELEFVRVVTKIEYPWYNEDSSADEETENVEHDDTQSESGSSESESSESESDCENEHENKPKGDYNNEK